MSVIMAYPEVRVMSAGRKMKEGRTGKGVCSFCEGCPLGGSI